MNVLPNWTWTWFNWELSKIKPQSKEFSDQMWKLGLAAAFVFAHHKYISTRQKYQKRIRNREEFEKSRIERFSIQPRTSRKEFLGIKNSEEDDDTASVDHSVISTMDNSVASSVMYVNELRLKQGKSIPPIPSNSATFSPFLPNPSLHRSHRSEPISSRSQHVSKGIFCSPEADEEYSYDDYIRENVQVEFEEQANPLLNTETETRMIVSPQKRTQLQFEQDEEEDFFPFSDEQEDNDNDNDENIGWNETERMELYQRMEDLMNIIHQNDTHIKELYELLLHVTHDFELSKSLEEALLKMHLPIFHTPFVDAAVTTTTAATAAAGDIKRLSKKGKEYHEEQEQEVIEYTANPLSPARHHHHPPSHSIASHTTTTSALTDNNSATAKLVEELQAQLAKQQAETKSLQVHCDRLFSEKTVLQKELTTLQQAYTMKEQQVNELQRVRKEDLTQMNRMVEMVDKSVNILLPCITTAAATAIKPSSTTENDANNGGVNNVKEHDIVPTPKSKSSIKIPTTTENSNKNDNNNAFTDIMLSPISPITTTSSSPSTSMILEDDETTEVEANGATVPSYAVFHTLLHDKLSIKLTSLQSYVSSCVREYHTLQENHQVQTMRLLEVRNALNTLRLTKVQEVVELHRNMMAMQTTNREKENFYLHHIQQLMSNNRNDGLVSPVAVAVAVGASVVDGNNTTNGNMNTTGSIKMQSNNQSQYRSDCSASSLSSSSSSLSSSSSSGSNKYPASTRTPPPPPSPSAFNYIQNNNNNSNNTNNHNTNYTNNNNNYNNNNYTNNNTNNARRSPATTRQTLQTTTTTTSLSPPPPPLSPPATFNMSLSSPTTSTGPYSFSTPLTTNTNTNTMTPAPAKEVITVGNKAQADQNSVSSSGNNVNVNDSEKARMKASPTSVVYPTMDQYTTQTTVTPTIGLDAMHLNASVSSSNKLFGVSPHASTLLSSTTHKRRAPPSSVLFASPLLGTTTTTTTDTTLEHNNDHDHHSKHHYHRHHQQEAEDDLYAFYASSTSADLIPSVQRSTPKSQHQRRSSSIL